MTPLNLLKLLLAALGLVVVIGRVATGDTGATKTSTPRTVPAVSTLDPARLDVRIAGPGV